MSKKVLNNRFKKTFNKGDFLSAKISADLRKNQCACGGKFTEKEIIKKYEIPACDKCGENPDLYRIRATVIDMAGQKKRIEIRHDQEGNRLKDVFDVISTLKRINQEVSEGTFDVRRYDSKLQKEAFLFENFAERYLSDYNNKFKRGEISASGVRKKKSLIKHHLLPYFSGMDINTISSPKIKEYASSFTEKLRTRDLSMAELKCMLNYALEYELIHRIPKFEKIPQAKRREIKLTVDEIIHVISHMEGQFYKDIFTLLLIYSVRPGELRALQWGDIDFRKGQITFQRHFCDETIVDGRKSVSIDKPKGKLVRPITPEALGILNRQPRSFRPDDLVFPGRKGGKHGLSNTTLPRVWNKTREMLGLPYIASYEIRHASGTEKYAKHKDIYLISEDLGHTNISTTTRYATVDDEKIKELYQ